MGKNAFSVKIGIFFFQLQKRGVDLCHTAHPKGECEEPSHWMIAGGKFGVWQMTLMWPLETLPLAETTSRPYSQGLQVTTETCLHMDLSSLTLRLMDMGFCRLLWPPVVLLAQLCSLMWLRSLWRCPNALCVQPWHCWSFLSFGERHGLCDSR